MTSYMLAPRLATATTSMVKSTITVPIITFAHGAKDTNNAWPLKFHWRLFSRDCLS